jgi:ectoine hydroxylase-related dioxygenase (phytanoyl-CoA dioxygenase family)
VITHPTSLLQDDWTADFRRDGFIVIERLIDDATVRALRNRFEPLFAGEFETGTYPDEWHWRKGLSLPDVTRQMANAWKSDRTIARTVLSPEIGELAATLAGWDGTRLGEDTLWWKPAGAREIALHQDATYVSFLDPAETLTVWIALDDATAETGTIEYVRGSHRWPLSRDPGDFHAPDRDYRATMREAAAAIGVAEPEIVTLDVSAGSCVIHHGRVWHGSGPNRHSSRPRRSIGVHTLSSSTRFRPRGAGYIYGRYQHFGDTTMDETFFPIMWTRDGHRSPSIAHHLEAPSAHWISPARN